jgi:ethanolamine transporter EutH
MLKHKILAAVGIASALVLPIALPMAHAQMSTSTLGASIDTVNTTTMDYFTVLLAKYWPFVVGFLILLGVWYFGRHIVNSFR